MDFISKLPPNIIETILCLVPIKEAVRTSILSKGWRYRWTKIPKLAFIQEPFDFPVLDQTSRRKVIMTHRRKFLNAICQVLLMHQGPIHEFALSMDIDRSYPDINYILSQLSLKNTVKKVTLDFLFGYRLPLSLFSLHQLTDLHLIRCDVYHLPTFDGFGGLLTLSMLEVMTSKETLLYLLSNCPLLKTLDMIDSTMEGRDGSTIGNLFKCLPLIENLSIGFGIIECFAQGGVTQVLPTALVHLKYLRMKDICFVHKYGLPILVLLIRSSPKLEKLKLEIINDGWVEKSERKDYVTLEGCSDIWLEHLNELEIKNLIYRNTELEFVKLILAKSPMMKKVRIFLFNEVAKDEELEISRMLLHTPHASPVVEIIVEVVGGTRTNTSVM